jgi:vacuolar protein sorting-associated protein 13A/C
MRAAHGTSTEEEQSWLGRIVRTILRLIQVRVTRVHIQYEDDVTDPKNPFTLGVGFDSMTLGNCDVRFRRCLLSA